MSIECSLPAGDKNDWESLATALVESDRQGDPFALVALLQWLKDMNWPGADVAAQHLRSTGQRTFALAVEVLHTKDDSWRYNVITRLIAHWPTDLQMNVALLLERLVICPSPAELEESLDIASARVLCESGLLPGERLREIAACVLRNNPDLSLVDAEFFREYARCGLANDSERAVQ